MADGKCFMFCNLAYPTGPAGRSTEALWECRAPSRRAVVCRVQTRPELAKENRRNFSRGSQEDQECILRLESLDWHWKDSCYPELASNCYEHALHDLIRMKQPILYKQQLLSGRYAKLKSTWGFFVFCWLLHFWSKGNIQWLNTSYQLNESVVTLTFFLLHLHPIVTP